MKIELICSCCSLGLHVDQEHAGKLVRCPGCQGLTRIPAAEKFGLAAGHPSKFSAPMEEWKKFSDIPVRPLSRPNQPDRSTRAALGLALGIVGIFLNFSCSCLFPVWLFLNFYGLYVSFDSVGSLRTAGMVANVVALAIGLSMGLLVALRILF